MSWNASISACGGCGVGGHVEETAERHVGLYPAPSFKSAESVVPNGYIGDPLTP